MPPPPLPPPDVSLAAALPAPPPLEDLLRDFLDGGEVEPEEEDGDDVGSSRLPLLLPPADRPLPLTSLIEGKSYSCSLTLKCV